MDLNFKTMRRSQFFTLLLVVVLLCNACEKVIEFDIPEAEPLIVVNAFVSDGDTVTMKVSSSLSYLESTTELPVISNASISMSNESESYSFEESMNNPGTYKSNEPYTGEGGLSLSVSAQGFKEITSETEVPKSVTGNLEILESQESEYKLRLTFEDGVGVKDYYHLLFVETVETDLLSFTNSFSSNDEVLLASRDGFLDEENYFSNDALFTDQFFENGEASIDFNVELVNNEFSQYEVHLIRASRDYYEYHRSFFLARNSDPIFGQPVQVYTNISNGIGVFGGYSVTKIPLEI